MSDRLVLIAAIPAHKSPNVAVQKSQPDIRLLLVDEHRLAIIRQSLRDRNPASVFSVSSVVNPTHRVILQVIANSAAAGAKVNAASTE
jgi:hypothetical protein